MGLVIPARSFELAAGDQMHTSNAPVVPHRRHSVTARCLKFNAVPHSGTPAAASRRPIFEGNDASLNYTPETILCCGGDPPSTKAGLPIARARRFRPAAEAKTNPTNLAINPQGPRPRAAHLRNDNDP